MLMKALHFCGDVVFMLFGYGVASTRPPELLRFGW